LCTDNKDRVKAWFQTGKDYKAAKVAYDNEDDAAAVRGKMGTAMSDVTDALDAAEEVKVKSDKGTLKDVKALEKGLKATEKREKAFLKTATTAKSTAEGDRDRKVTLLGNADTELKTILKEGKQEATE
jgi:hypothetical protein